MNKEMETLIKDINPKEIASQIETDTLIEWCEILRFELIRTLNKMERSAEPKIGHWIEDDEQIHVEKTYHCSECGYDIWGVNEKSNYCPNCGARMQRRETNE